MRGPFNRTGSRAAALYGREEVGRVPPTDPFVGVRSPALPGVDELTSWSGVQKKRFPIGYSIDRRARHPRTHCEAPISEKNRTANAEAPLFHTHDSNYTGNSLYTYPYMLNTPGLLKIICITSLFEPQKLIR